MNYLKSTLILSSIIFLSSLGYSKVEVHIYPEKPRAGEKIMIYANITGDIENVSLLIEECKERMCYLPKVVEMEEIGEGSYMVEYLTREDSTIIKFKLNISYANGSYLETSFYEVHLEKSSNRKRNTPGSGIILMMLVVLLVALSRRLYS